MKKYAAEFIATFALVFCGTGAAVIDQQTNGTISHAGVAITFGLIVMAMIYSFGEISGSHMNPAVTISFAALKNITLKDAVFYIIFQLLGAIAASLVLHVMFPENQSLGATLPAGSEMQSFILEMILTFFLMLVVLLVVHASEQVKALAGIVIGSVVLLEAMFAGPICGASMNPARSIAPDIVSGNFTSLWIYITAPVAGALTASLTWHYLFKNKTS